MAFTPVLSKSRFSNSERNSVTFKSQIVRESRDSDIIITRCVKQVKINDLGKTYKTYEIKITINTNNNITRK